MNSLMCNVNVLYSKLIMHMFYEEITNLYLIVYF